MGNKFKKKKESVFVAELNAARRNQLDASLTEEERKDRRYEKLDGIFEIIANKKNRYLFYCPDIPFANSMVKIIYEYAYRLHKAGFTVRILHEVKGFKADWLNYEWKKELNIDYLQEKKNNRLTESTYSFRPTDSVIIPDGFWTVMENMAEMKTLHKIVLAFGYGGVITAKPGLNWGNLGFQDVLCVSQKLADDYKSIWPGLNYYVTGYELELDKLVAPIKEKIRPVIGLMTRNREDASQIINTFYARYRFVDIFEFKILKKLSTHQYIESLKQCAVLVFLDEGAGYPAPPVEAIAMGIPVISIYGRGMTHLANQEGIMWLPNNDLFVLTEAIANFCYGWIVNPTRVVTDKKITEGFSSDKIVTNLINTFEEFQQIKTQTFVAIKNAVDEGKLSDEQLSINEQITE